MSARLEAWDQCATSETVLMVTGIHSMDMGWHRPFDGSSFTCAYCRTVSAWRAGDAPPRKCWACGAPRQA